MAKTPLKIRHLQRKLYLRSKSQTERKFYSLYDKICRMDILKEAYSRCRLNQGGAGVDGLTFHRIEREIGVYKFLSELQRRLVSKNYTPHAVRRCWIPKGKRKRRPLGIPTIADRVVQMACNILLQAIYEPHLHQDSYGYRPKRSAHDAIKAINGYLQRGYVHVVDADLKEYFDSIPHQKLMDKLNLKISDGSFLRLIKSFLKAPIQEIGKNGKAKTFPNRSGTPQGGVCSPILANIYLNDFLHLITGKTPVKIVSYADDFVLLHKEPFTQMQQDWLRKVLNREDLNLHPEKTRIIDMRVKGEEFDFLGFNFKHVKGFYRKTRYIKIQPSKSSQAKFKDKLRGIVKHRTSLTLDQLIQRVNPIIRGWKQYFCAIGYPRSVFFKLDWFVVGRFYRWSRNRSQRRSLFLSQDAWRKLEKAGLFFLQPASASIR